MGLFISWWYGEQLKNTLEYFKVFLAYLFDLFSVRICLSTLFAVWRRDQINYKGLPLKEIFQAWSLNLASRIVGFFVKISTITVYLIITLLFLILAGVFLVLWLCFPLLIAGLIYFGLKTIMGL